MLVHQRVSSQNIFGCGIPLWSYTDISNVMDRFGQRLTASPPFCWPISPKYHWEPMFLHIKPWMTEHIQQISTSKWDDSMVHPLKKHLKMGMVEILCLQRFQFGAPRRCPLFFLLGRAKFLLKQHLSLD